jgi:hypothetical protein
MQQQQAVSHSSRAGVRPTRRSRLITIKVSTKKTIPMLATNVKRNQVKNEKDKWLKQ